MSRMVVLHSETKDCIYPLSRQKIFVKLKSAVGSLKSIEIQYWNRFFENEIFSYKMILLGNDSQFDFFGCELSFPEPVKYLKYYFVLNDGTNKKYYSTYGVSSEIPTKPFEYQWANDNEVFRIPKWSNGIVSYQIFIDRFFRSSIKKDNTLANWDDYPNRENFYGGDIKGIIKKLNHIKDLGIKLIYLNPIFQSHSNHKYDTTDYFLIDPSFGTVEDLRELVDLCHKNDIRIILDGVFNHIGYYSEQFQDVIENGKNSKFWDWFYINGDSVNTENLNYECVGYYKWMPKLNYSNKEVRTFILKVGKYWLVEAGIDGWRLDVADEVDYTFWQEFRAMVKAVNHDAILIGETWKNGSDLLRGDQMDTIMNYLFRDAVVDFFAKKSIESNEFNNRIQRMLFNYPTITHNCLYNLLDSHDTPRFLTECEMKCERMKLAIVFQMTFPGIPAVYYGDETGVTGENDPGCRKPMNWDSMDSKILRFYKKMIGIRNKSKALMKGSFKIINLESGLYGYAREFGDETINILINNSDLDVTTRVIIDDNLEKYSVVKSLVEDNSYKLQTFNNDIILSDKYSIRKHNRFYDVIVKANQFEILKFEKGGE